MKKLIYILVFALLGLIGCVIIKKYIYIHNSGLSTEKQGITSKMLHKGLRGAVDFVLDENGNCYIAYDRKIQFISSNGKSFDVLNNTKNDITSIDYYKGNLYAALGSEVIELNPRTRAEKILIDNLPNYGDYKKTLVRIRNDCIYITLGTLTNSGICGSDNEWIKTYPYNHDITPKDIILRGLNFGDENTGAFVPYKTKNAKGQMIPGHFPGNGSLIIYYLKDNSCETFAWGIRNITGIDFTSRGRIIAGVGGMEDRGLRPVKGDTDYVYEIKKDTWYGWPDYSGGDPITSPKFKDSKGSIPFILENHVSTNPPAPLYQLDRVDTLKGIAVDKNGCIGDIDDIYFYDSYKNEVLSLGKSVVPVPFISLAYGKNKITSMKFAGNSLLLLDSENGIMYIIYRDTQVEGYTFDKKVILYLLITAAMGIIIAINNKI